jgi:hypothetical protein
MELRPGEIDALEHGTGQIAMLRVDALLALA